MKYLRGETSNVTDSPVDEKSAASDRKAFIQQCTVNEINALVDEQSAGAETKIGNPVDEQSAGTMHGAGNPVDGQSAGLTEKQQSSDAGTLLKGKVKGQDEDILKKILTETIDAILDQDGIDLRHNTLLDHKIDTGCAMPIRQFMRMSFGIPVEEVDVTAFYSKEGRKFHMTEEHVCFIKGGRRYSWDIPPGEGNKAEGFTCK